MSTTTNIGWAATGMLTVAAAITALMMIAAKKMDEQMADIELFVRDEEDEA